LNKFDTVSDLGDLKRWPFNIGNSSSTFVELSDKLENKNLDFKKTYKTEAPKGEPSDTCNFFLNYLNY